jgi:hypothetical protein
LFGGVHCARGVEREAIPRGLGQEDKKPVQS